MLRMKKKYRLIIFICLLAVYKKLIGTGRVLGTSILRYEFLRKSGLNFCMYTTLGQGQEITLTFNTLIPSYVQLDVCSY